MPERNRYNRVRAIVLGGTLLLGMGGCDRSPPEPPADADSDLGSGVWICPMDPEVVLRENVPCPECGMALKPAHGAGAFVCAVHVDDGSIDIEAGDCRTCGKPRMRVGTTKVFLCPRHPGVELETAGSCPVCETALKPERRAVFFRCLEHLDPVSAQAGACKACSAPLERVVRRLPHGDHNPKHGGEFFMAADRWHHLEGTVPEPGLFRLYIYDNYTRALVSHEVTGYVRLGRTTDDGDIVLETAKQALDPVPGECYLEVRNPEIAPPRELAAFVKFAAAGASQEERFDFSFVELSKGTPAAGTAPERVKFVVPDTLAEMLAALADRVAEVKSMVRERDLELLYRPALEARDLVLALEEQAGLLKGSDRRRLARVAADFVRSAWRLDLYGDDGNLRKTQAAQADFSKAAKELAALFRDAAR